MCCSYRGLICLFSIYAVLILIITFTLDLIALVALNAPFLFQVETNSLNDVATSPHYRHFGIRWNYLISGLHVIDHRILWNIVLLFKLLLGLLQFITLPLMIIGNRAGRSSYLKPYKTFGLINLVYALGISLYFLFGYTDVNFYSTLPEWIEEFYRNPNELGGMLLGKLCFLVTLSDGGPVAFLLSLFLLFLIDQRGSAIRKKKDALPAQQNWDMQLRPFNRPKTSDEDLSPLSAHFNQPSANNMSSVSHTLNQNPLSSNEQINVNTAPFSYTNTTTNGAGGENHPHNSATFYDNRAFQRN